MVVECELFVGVKWLISDVSLCCLDLCDVMILVMFMMFF